MPEWMNDSVRWLRRKLFELSLPGPRLRLMGRDLVRIRRRIDSFSFEHPSTRPEIMTKVDLYALVAEVEWWRRTFGAPPPHPQGYGVDLKDAPDNIEYRRAGGDVICGRCGKTYYKHPKTEHRDWNGDPWLVELCDGSLVKL